MIKLQRQTAQVHVCTSLGLLIHHNLAGFCNNELNKISTFSKIVHNQESIFTIFISGSFKVFAQLIFLKIIVQLRTTYLNNFGEEITDKKQIAKNYIYSLDFVVDVLSIIYNPAT